MNRILTLTMIMVGILCGTAAASDGASASYVTPMLVAGAMATLIRLKPIDF